MNISFLKFKNFINKIKDNFKFSYRLSNEEKHIWKSIEEKSNNGLIECQCEYGNNATPWIQELTEEELKLLNKIHDYFYGENWYIADPLGAKQVQYIMYDDIKDKVRK